MKTLKNLEILTPFFRFKKKQNDTIIFDGDLIYSKKF